MSRTDNTMPIAIQEEDGKHACWTVGGSYHGIGLRSRWANRKQRKMVRVQLKLGKDPDISQSRHYEKSIYW